MTPAPCSDEAPLGLGLHDDHNAGVAAVAGGRVVLYAEMERYTRVKNESGWRPTLVEELLRTLPLDRLRAICAPQPEVVARFLIERFGAEPAGKRRVSLGGRAVDLYGQDDRHGYLHILSMMVLPGLEPALYATLVADAGQPRVGWIDLREPLRQLPALHLMEATADRWFNGEIFSGLFGTLFYGSNELEHCGKLMGLASWGRVRLDYVAALRRLAVSAFDETALTWEGYEAVRAEDLRRATDAALHVDPARHETAEAQDLAASAQELFRHELIASVAFGLARAREDLARRGLPEARAMLYSGGCGLSVVTNAALRTAVGMPLIVAPYAHDAAQFLGSAVYATLRSSPGEAFPIGCGWPGIPEHTLGVVRADDLSAGGLTGRPVSPRHVAERLLAGELIACVSGGAEAGPRALGQRSLLANGLDPAIRDRINFDVKKREWYRPLAPMVLTEEFPRDFAEDSTLCARYMLDSFCLRPQYRGLLSAVSSPDGMARAQAIGPDRPWLHQLIREVGALTTHPLVLNTSLNAPGRPIALDAAQVLGDGEALGIEAVVCDGILWSRTAPRACAAASPKWEGLRIPWSR